MTKAVINDQPTGMFTGITLIFYLLIGCDNKINSGKSDLPEYDLENPEITLILPDTLREISGLTIINDKTIACVQDENGILFIYNISRNKIQDQYTFNIDGDYEGITRVDNTIYILQSDGVLYEISNYDKKEFKINSYPIPTPSDNNEGLCYDQKNDRLLIASKTKPGKGPENKNRREIYSFDLKTKKLSEEPIYNFDVETIIQFALDNNLDLPEKTRKKGNDKVNIPVMKLFTSAIAIQPVTHDLYLLSAADHMLFIFGPEGSIKHAEMLDETTFNKAEGISFFDNGDMLITNEAQDKHATLMRFNYRQQK
ncbi:MAG: hypothetical protein ACHQFW_01135 [Chitinophagales bacterium]